MKLFSSVADEFAYIAEEASDLNANNYKITRMKGESSVRSLNRLSLGMVRICCIELSLVFF